MPSPLFNGAILNLAAPAALVGGVTLYPTWPAPAIDTMGFWAPGAPDRFTIPIGVTIAQFWAGARTTGAVSPDTYFLIQNQMGINIASQSNHGGGIATGNCTTGPIQVSGGNWFRAGFLAGVNKTLDPTQRVFFTVQALQWVCP